MSKQDKFVKRRLYASAISTVVSISLVLFMLGLVGFIILTSEKISLMVKENIELELARDIGCKGLNWRDSDYIPHLSLNYGDYTKKEKEKMVSKIHNVPNGFIVKNIFLVYNNEINLPHLTLLLTGGHTQIYLIKNFKKILLLGETVDDALGEAFEE